MRACRICNAPSINRAGDVEYIAGYSCEVFDCKACGCRFTKHDATIYDLLHETGAISYYRDYKKFAQQCQSYFDRADKEMFKRFLTRVSKYKFIIERAAFEPGGARMLEIGSSRGYLTSYFILNGRPILGVDVSNQAVESARELYGDHFAVFGDPRIRAQGPYDFIYHVGTIGCVADPVGLTRDLLSLLRPGGQILFNAPNRAALALRGQLWFDSAPPPDVVTLFPLGFWTRQFSDVADVVEQEETVGSEESLVIRLRQMFRPNWSKPEPANLYDGDVTGRVWAQHFGVSWQLIERICRKVGRMSRAPHLVPQQPSEFGLYISITPRPPKNA